MIKWGIIGLGRMACIFAESIKELKETKLVAAASLNSSRLRNFSKKYNIVDDFQFSNYDEILKCKEIDAIYISTLNNTHAELITKSIRAKKNVLCEKPITVHYQEMTDIIKVIENENVHFSEAIAYRSHPITTELVQLLKQKEVGKIESIESSFSFLVKRINPYSRLFNKKLGGGAILDVGCYPLSFLNLISNLDESNNDIIIEKANGKFCMTGVDEFCTAELVVSGYIKAKITAGIRKLCKNVNIIKTSNGQIRIVEPWTPGKKTYIEVDINSSYYKKFVMCNHSIYANQINLFNKMIKDKSTMKFPYLTFNDTVKISKLSSEWRKKIEL
ncbi:Gfo/Idh/MocA family oxidoreductase [Candidatus Pelagibacter sp.]|nr:Gfo/Idh/MocA family oxidoreductase [Candidatus Pelagibacter sp.]